MASGVNSAKFESSGRTLTFWKRGFSTSSDTERSRERACSDKVVVMGAQECRWGWDGRRFSSRRTEKGICHLIIASSKAYHSPIHCKAWCRMDVWEI